MLHRLRKAAWAAALCVLLTGCFPFSLLRTDHTSQATQEPSVLPAITEQATALPTSAQPLPPGEYEYYVVDENQRQGVVDGLGNKVLPFDFAVIRPIVHLAYTYDDQAGYQEGKPGSPMLFFAQPATVHYDKNESAEALGYLYDTHGKQLNEQAYTYAYAISKDLIRVTTHADTGRYQSGLVSFTGQIILPCVYDEIVLFPNGNVLAWTGDEGNRTATVLNHEGAEIAKQKVNVLGLANRLIIARDESGLCGLMDDQFHWVLPALWEWIYETTVPDEYIVTLQNKSGVMNDKGELIIPAQYSEIQPFTDDAYPGHTLYIANSEAGPCLLDDTGETLFQAPLYQSLRYQGGIILAFRAGSTSALDLKGHDMLPGVEDILSWSAEFRLFQCGMYGGGYKCYTADGEMLPLPAVDSGYLLTGDRFVLNQIPNQTGLCDAQGHWIISPEESQYLYRQRVKDKDLIIRVQKQQNYAVYTLVDMDGHEVLNKKYDQLSGSSEYQSLLYAQTGPIHGLIDLEGNWIWYTSDYNSLMD